MKIKIVSNPIIGYGSHTIKYADGTTREFYQIGLSANKTGISVYILGIKNKALLSPNVRKKTRQGKREQVLHQVQKAINDINIDVLEAAIRYGVPKPWRA